MNKYEKGTFSITPNKEYLRGRPSEMQIIFFWLCDRANDKGQCYPARRTLAKDSGCGLKSIDKYLLLLEEEGFIKVEPKYDGDGRQTSNLYQIVLKTGESQNGYTPLVENATQEGSKKGTQTIPIINNTQLTISSTDETSVPIKEEVDHLVMLPEKFGNTPIMRLLKVYNSLWYGKYKMVSKGMSIGRFGKAMKSLLEGYTEVQVSALLYMYFNWQGPNGNDSREYEFVSKNGFTPEFLVKKADLIAAYINNALNVNFDDNRAIREYSVRVLKSVL